MKSFVFQHEELHCNIYFLVIEAKTHKLQMKKALSDLNKLGFPVTEKVKELYGITVTDDVADAILIGKYGVVGKAVESERLFQNRRIS